MPNFGEQYTDDAVTSVFDASVPINTSEPSNLKEILNFASLYESMWKCRKGVMWKDSVCSYVLNGIESTLRLEKELQTNTYKPRPPKFFVITHPKRREIISVAFKDRVYQRALNDNIIYPTMIRSFIYDNMACQKGKGTDRARGRLKCFLQREFRRHKTNFFVLQIDIHGYYPHMSHCYTEKMFERQLPISVTNRIKQILNTQYKGNIGYNPGSQLIQIAGISTLNPLDHYIKEALHIKSYIRYMDDLILMSEDKEYLQRCQEEIKYKLSEIGFTFNPKKTKIYPVSDGVMFLGFTFKLTETNKVLMILDPHNVKNERRKLKKLVKLSKTGKISKDKVKECYMSWKDHARKGNSFKLLQRMDKYFKELWGE